MKKILWLAVLSVALASCSSVGKNIGEAKVRSKRIDKVSKVVPDSLRNKLYTVAAPDKYTCCLASARLGISWSMSM